MTFYDKNSIIKMEKDVDKMLQVIVKLIGAILVLIGIIFVYDARILTKKFFGFGDQNEASQRIEDFRFFTCYCWRINFIFCVNLLDR